MDKTWKIVIIVALVLAVGVVVILKQKNKSVAIPEQPTAANLPRLIELGRDKCIPCKLMAPILAELKEEYSGKLIVESIDVGKDPAIARKYQIRIIPTQIFLDPDGKELFRHENFMSKEDILAKWKQLGFSFDESDTTSEK